MELRIRGWESIGLRCPDVTIDVLGQDKMSPVTLIQMPNGTGKTTTLDMIRAALTGEARHWSEEKVREYRSLDGERTNGQFKLELLVDDRPLTFEVNLDFVEGRVQYRTTSPSIGGVVSDWKPPSDVRRFLNDKFIGLFVFDGEFANSLLKAEDAEAERAIDALCQLYLFDECSEKANEAWDRATRNRGARSSSALSREKEKVKRIENRLKKLEKRYSEAKAKREDISVKIATLQEEVDKILSEEADNLQELDGLREREISAEQHVKDSTENLMRAIRNPHQVDVGFRCALSALKKQLDRVRLPTSTSKQFFIELSQEEICICGRPIDDDARSAILMQADRYLGEEISGVLNALKGDIELHALSLDDGSEDYLQKLRDELNRSVNAWHQASSQRQALQAQIVEGSDKELKSKQELLDKLKNDLDELNDLIDILEAPAKDGDDEETFSLASLNQQLKKAKRRVDEISDTVEFGEQTRIIQEMCRIAKEKARTAIRKELVSECNRWLERVLSRAPVRLANIARSLELENQKGASVGQTLAVGYTFLASLLHRGQHGFPLIVDSPANPIDISVRREVGLMVPKLCRQFIAFTISSERKGFVSALHESSEGNVRYLTLFRRAPSTNELQNNLPEDCVSLTDTGVLVEGREYFEAFDLDQEPEE